MRKSIHTHVAGSIHRRSQLTAGLRNLDSTQFVADQLASSELGGNELCGNELCGNEQGGNEQGGNEQGGNEQGAALIEMAVTLPLLLLILTGVFAFGVAFNNYLLLTEGVAVGARQLAISRGQTTDPCSTTSTAVYAAAPSLTQSKFVFTLVLNGTTYSGSTCSSGSTTTGAAGNLVQGQSAQVSATFPCSMAVYGVNLVPGCTLKAQTTELVQ